MFRAQKSIDPDYHFDYLKLRQVLEHIGEISKVIFVNSASDPAKDLKNPFHFWMESPPPLGPGIKVKLLPLKASKFSRAFCTTCKEQVDLVCPHVHGKRTKKATSGKGKTEQLKSHSFSSHHQKGIDVTLSTLALTLKDTYDSLILSSGDGDLGETMHFLANQGKGIQLATFDWGVSNSLLQQVDGVIPLARFAELIQKGDRLEPSQEQNLTLKDLLKAVGIATAGFLLTKAKTTIEERRRMEEEDEEDPSV
ncbi:MAG: NYN domain-containing protein [Planctomycetes bacterium]|nr:NYN domain-containing protein [Planctomycetota bacterium]